MPSWRCPHCSTPQAEASRCWVCHRSSTSCGTCRQFRAAVAGRYGFCGLDRKRNPLSGDEIRACWQDAAVPVPADPAMPGLLDLLTDRALGTPASSSAGSTAAGASAPVRSATSAASRADGGGGRLWVEVDA